MKITNIKFLTPLKEIPDIENDNIDISIMLENNIEYTLVVTTPQNLIWYMNKENKQFIEAAPPDIIVKSLTEENIYRAVETYAEGNAYWLKLYFLAGYWNDVFSNKKLDNIIDKIKSY